MMAPRFGTRVGWPIVWRGGLVLAAAAAVIIELATPVRLPPMPRHEAAPPRAEPAAPAPQSGPIIATYQAIAQHPLFSPTRTPYTPPKPAPSAATAESSPLRNYLLLGTIIEGGTQVALLKAPGNGSPIRAVPGAVIAGWRLREITPDTARFENGSARFTLQFPHPRWPHP